MTVQVIAHRGASHAARENTLTAFTSARRMGADGVELDVRRTADDVLVVHHDSRLDDGRIVRELHAQRLPPHVPTLSSALDACAGMWVNLEIKNDPAEPDFDPTEWVAHETVAMLIERGEQQRWLISSFRIETIDTCRRLAPDVGTGWLTTITPHDAVAVLLDRGHAALHPWVDLLDRDLLDECHAAGIAVNTWTCDDPVRMTELITWGIDGICTDDPDVAVAMRAELGAASG